MQQIIGIQSVVIIHLPTLSFFFMERGEIKAPFLFLDLISISRNFSVHIEAAHRMIQPDPCVGAQGNSQIWVNIMAQTMIW